LANIPKTVLDCTVVKDPEDREGFRMKYTVMGNQNKITKFCDAGMDPYMFLKRSDKWVLKDHRDEFRGTFDNGEFINFNGESVIRLDMPGPRQTGEFRNLLESKYHIHTFESDIPFYRRWMIDMGIRQPLLKKILYVDIEVDARTGFCTPDYPEGQIVSIAAVGSDGKEYFFCNRDEGYILRHFYNLVASKYEVITGWNFCGEPTYGVPFDWPYILARTKKIELHRYFIPIQQMDAYRAYLKFTDFETKGVSNSLDAVSLRHLGVGKHGKYDANLAWDSLVNDPEHKWLYEYNMQDARLVQQLDAELDILGPYIVSVTKLPVFLRDLDKMSIVWEAMLLDRCRQTNPRPVFPRKRMVHLGDVRGALTFEPTPGVHDSVLVVDYAGLYISVMQLIGISPEMVLRFRDYLVNEEGIDPEALLRSTFVTVPVIKKYVEFVQSQENEPLYKQILTELTSTRDEQKELRKKHPLGSLEYKYYNAAQKFTKTVLVSGYGVQGLRSQKKKEFLSRWYSPLMANMITFVAREIQGWTRKYFEKRGWIVTYGDTDSVFLKKKGFGSFDLGLMAKELTEECTKDVRNWVHQILGIDDTSFLFIKAEKVYSEIIHGLEKQKKRYMGYQVWLEDEGFIEKKYDVVGAWQIRSDAFELLKEAENEITNLMFKHRDDARAHVDDYLSRLRRMLLDSVSDPELKAEVIPKLVIEKGMNKPPLAYAEGNQLRRIAMQLLDRGGFRPGERLRWLQVATKPKKVEFALSPEDELDQIQMDYSGYMYYYERVKKMVDVWVPEATIQMSMEAFSS